VKKYDSEKRAGILRRTAAEARNYRVQMRFLSLALVLLVIVASVVYAAAALYKQTGSFTVSVDKYEHTQYGLTLSESRDMSYKTSQLNANISKQMTNIDANVIPDNVDMIDGEHNGDHYIAYTFYLQNAGQHEVAVNYNLKMSGITNSLDEAIRIRLYVNGTPTTYAKTASDGSGAEPLVYGDPESPKTTEFFSQSFIVNERIDSLMAEEKVKFTVVIWIEGNDPDCIDWLIGGKLKIDMNMNIAS